MKNIMRMLKNKFDDSICFTVDIDTCLMEVVVPRTTWVMPMGYEVDKDLLVSYTNHLLAQPIDTTIERFGTYKEKLQKVHYDL